MASRLSDRLVLEAALGARRPARCAAVHLRAAALRAPANGELTSLHDTAQGMADQRPPGWAERLRQGEQVDVDAESPPRRPARSRDRRVGQAFATVQRTR
jgi:hypothetical protein